MLLLPNTPQLVISFFGVLKAGAVAVFTLPTTKPNELIDQVQDSGSRILVTLNQFESIARQVITQPDTPLKQVLFTCIADYLPAAKFCSQSQKPAHAAACIQHQFALEKTLSDRADKI